MNSLIVLAKQEFGENMKVYDVNNLKAIHVQRQQRNIQLYTDCTRCHPDGVPGTIPQPEEAGAKRSRAGNGFRIFPRFRELNSSRTSKLQSTSLIEFHVSKF